MTVEPAVYHEPHIKFDDEDELEQVDMVVTYQSGAAKVKQDDTEVFYPPQYAPVVIGERGGGTSHEFGQH